MHRHVFGPVLSSRLGRSLGLDLLGAKICSQDCVYCECGPTRTLTLTRKPYVPAEDILAQLSAWREAGHPLPDCITLGGSGEPTLNVDLPRILEGARRLFPGLPVAVLTNSTLLRDPEVRFELCAADIVLPSLDALVLDEFEVLCRPHHLVCLAELAQGLRAFRREFTGRLYLEVFLARGLNDSAANLRLLKGFCQKLGPDRVDVVTLTRPGTDPNVAPVGPDVLANFSAELDPGFAARTGSIPEGRLDVRSGADEGLARELVLASLLRRPQTVADLARALALDAALVQKVVEDLCGSGRLVRLAADGAVFYSTPRGG